MKFLSTNGIQVGPFSEMKNLCLNIGLGLRIFKILYLIQEADDGGVAAPVLVVFVSVTDGETQLKDTMRLKYSEIFIRVRERPWRLQTKTKMIKLVKFNTIFVKICMRLCHNNGQS